MNATPNQISLFSHLCNVNKETREIWPDRMINTTKGLVNTRKQDVEGWAAKQDRFTISAIIESFENDQPEAAISQIKYLL